MNRSRSFYPVFDWSNGETSDDYRKEKWKLRLKTIDQTRKKIKKDLMVFFSEKQSIEIIYRITTGKIKHLKINYKL